MSLGSPEQFTKLEIKIKTLETKKYELCVYIHFLSEKFSLRKLSSPRKINPRKCATGKVGLLVYLFCLLLTLSYSCSFCSFLSFLYSLVSESYLGPPPQV